MTQLPLRKQLQTFDAFDNLNTERVFYGNAISRLKATDSQFDAERLDLEENEERLVGTDLAERVTSHRVRQNVQTELARLPPIE
jgi:flagellin-like hook-associated protein FlgL